MRKKALSSLLTLLACCAFAACAVPGLPSPSETLQMAEKQRAASEQPTAAMTANKKKSASSSASPAKTAQTGSYGSTSGRTGAYASFSYSDVPAYSGEPYVAVNNNVPFFTSADRTDPPARASFGPAPDGDGVRSFEAYSDLDELGRCGAAISCVGEDIMPTEKRGDISEVKPSGWKQKMYSFVDGEALYNRCHLLGYQLTAENANWENLITGTRYMNTQGMLPFENMVADYVKETGNHVLYRVTPVFVGDELLARGVVMEAQSVEDHGEGVEYCVFAYNVQPGVGINYSNGRNWEDKGEGDPYKESRLYVLNTRTMRYHDPACTSVVEMNPASRQEYVGSAESLEKQGYQACGSCAA